MAVVEVAGLVSLTLCKEVKENILKLSVNYRARAHIQMKRLQITQVQAVHWQPWTSMLPNQSLLSCVYFNALFKKNRLIFLKTISPSLTNLLLLPSPARVRFTLPQHTGLESMHVVIGGATGMPFAGTIIVSTVLLRFLLTLPPTIYQHQVSYQS